MDGRATMILLKRLGLLLGVTLLVLLVAELALQLVLGPVVPVNFTPVPASIRLEPEAGVNAPYRLRPSSEGVQEFGSDPRGRFDPGATLTYRINALGFRGPETTREKPEGTLRVVGLGDSFTFGTGVRADETFLAVLEDMAQGGPRPVEVLNLGAMGYDTRHEVELLESVGVGLDPDVVVICLFLNDAGGGGLHGQRQQSASLLGRLRRSSHLLHRLAGVEGPADAGLDGALSAYRAAFATGSEGRRRVRSSLQHAVGLSERHGFDLALVIFPVLVDLASYPLADVHDGILAMGDKLGIATLDLAPAFAGHAGPELWIHPGNSHPNEIAHRIAGEALAEWLKAEGLLSIDR